MISAIALSALILAQTDVSPPSKSPAAIVACMYDSVGPKDRSRLNEAMNTGDIVVYFKARRATDRFTISKKCDPDFYPRMDRTVVLISIAIDLNTALAVLAQSGQTQSDLDAVRGPDVDPFFNQIRILARGGRTASELDFDMNSIGPLLAHFKAANLSAGGRVALLQYYVNRERLDMVSKGEPVG